MRSRLVSLLLLAGAVVAVLLPAARAVEGVEAFAHFLDAHPLIDQRLRENARLADNPIFLRNHPKLADFFASHPEVASALAAHPRWALDRELSHASPGEKVEFDRFLDQHPKIARELEHHPHLLSQDAFLASHAEAREFLEKHPGVRHHLESRRARIHERRAREHPSRGEATK
ncbi:hypothetical protein [Nibricoccus sp. IMCC34717]|uniref:hypothetical protein n=1 Tax=Nibricoccus sp. IMCC34717 TaxID=3034021 RepID=UPI0038510C05